MLLEERALFIYSKFSVYRMPLHLMANAVFTVVGFSKDKRCSRNKNINYHYFFKQYNGIAFNC